MSTQPNLNLSTRPVPLTDGLQTGRVLMPLGPEKEGSTGCWERFKDGTGWILSKVVWLFSRVGKVILWPFQIISGSAFRVLELVWPKMAARAEALWGHLAMRGKRIIAAFREEVRLDDIQRLERENEGLNARVHDLAVQGQLIRVQKDQIIWEQQIIIQERDRARREIEEKIREREQLIGEKHELQNANQQLQMRINEINAEKKCRNR